MEANREASAVLVTARRICSLREGFVFLSDAAFVRIYACLHVCTRYKNVLPLPLLCRRQIKICFCKYEGTSALEL